MATGRLRTQKDNIKMNIRDVGSRNLRKMELAQDRVKWRIWVLGPY